MRRRGGVLARSPLSAVRRKPGGGCCMWFFLLELSLNFTIIRLIKMKINYESLFQGLKFQLFNIFTEGGLKNEKIENFQQVFSSVDFKFVLNITGKIRKRIKFAKSPYG